MPSERCRNTHETLKKNLGRVCETTNRRGLLYFRPGYDFI